MQQKYYCTMCGKEIDLSKFTKSQVKYKLSKFKKDGRIYCCKECGMAYIGKVSSSVMTETNKRIAKQSSERMKKNNPMKDPAIRAKVSKRLKEIGHCPKIRCGNGCGLTVPQQKMLLSLSEKSVKTVYAEYAIPTKYAHPYKTRYPDCYKADIAIPGEMLAIEIDGSSHSSLERKEQDAKKEYCLNTLGWRVLRFTNKQVMEHLEECVQTVLSTISR